MITFEHVRQAVTLPDFDPYNAHNLMAPLRRIMKPDQNGDPPREAGVLVLIYPEVGDGLHVVLTRRTDHLRGHSGQVSFPGGRRDPEDTSFVDTALRETCEELGICQRTRIQVVGQLSRTYIPPSHFFVHPIVATMTTRPQFVPNPDEVAAVFTLPLSDLLNTQIKRSELRHFDNQPFDVPYYDVQGHKVWGATAIMLSELEHRLRSVVRGITAD